VAPCASRSPAPSRSRSCCRRATRHSAVTQSCSSSSARAWGVELGAPVELRRDDPGAGPRWLLGLDPEHAGAPALDWRPGEQAIRSTAADVAGLFETMNLWRTALRTGGPVEARDCASVAEASARVVDEVADTYPAFELRGLDWEAICAVHRERVAAADDPTAALQAWAAELQDSHTWVWPGHANLPYAARVDGGGVTFAAVPPGTPAYAAVSARAGAWRSSTARRPTPQAGSRARRRRRTRGRTSPAAACSPARPARRGGSSPPTGRAPSPGRRSPGGRCSRRWSGAASTGRPAIFGSPRGATTWGWRRRSTPPSPSSATARSSEDFLLGLQGLDHVTVVGRPSGGGSGRPRSVRLTPGLLLTVSSALTYDRDGRCVEGAGIPVDVPVPASAGLDAALAAARSL
jgi:carboxyl-terminal processing protease